MFFYIMEKKKLKFAAKSKPIAGLGTIYRNTLHADGEKHYIVLNLKRQEPEI